MRKLLVSCVVLVPILVIVGLACGTTTNEGVVAHQSITGSREGTSQTVLENRPGDDGSPFIHVNDKDLLSHFATDEEHLIISDSLAFQIESRYDRVDYFVNMAPHPPRDPEPSHTGSAEKFSTNCLWAKRSRSRPNRVEIFPRSQR